MPLAKWILGMMPALLTLGGCAYDQFEPTSEFANMTAPITAKRGQPVPVTLTLVAGSGCEDAAWVAADVNEMSGVVTFRGATKREVAVLGGRVCPQMVHYPEMVATFTPQKIGSYILRARVFPSSNFDYGHLEPRIDPRGYYREAIEVTSKVQVAE